MKKIKLSIAGLMLSGLSYSQSVDSLKYINSRNYDTIAEGVAGKIHFVFDYYTNKVIKKTEEVFFEDVTIKIKDNQVLYVDLYDDCSCNEHQNIIKMRRITIYFRNGTIKYHSNKSGDTTLKFHGKEVSKIIISKPKLKNYKLNTITNG